MEIEIFSENETGTTLTLTKEETEERDFLLSKIGLKGQDNFQNERKTETFAWHRATEEELFVYRVLFPEVDKIYYPKYDRDYKSIIGYELSSYDKEFIPTRVLKIIDTIIENKCFDELTICSPKTSIIDPVLFAKKKSDTGYYLIARWGSSLDSFETLKAKAIETYKNTMEDVLTALKSKIDVKLISVKSMKGIPNMDDLRYSDRISYPNINYLNI